MKANLGLLFPINNSFIFIHKPVIYLKHNQVKYVELHRVNKNGVASSRTFDLCIVMSAGQGYSNVIGQSDTDILFSNIDSTEIKSIEAYLKSRGLKTRYVINPGVSGEVDDEDDSEPETNQKGYKRKVTQSAAPEEEYDDEEDDESFNEEDVEKIQTKKEQTSEKHSEEESGEDSDMSDDVDQGVDADELAHLKGNKKMDKTTRRKR